MKFPKIIVSGFFFAIAVALNACGEDASGNGSSDSVAFENGTSENGNDGKVITQKLKVLYVDEENSTIVTSRGDVACICEDGSCGWKNIAQGYDNKYVYKYFFVQDTLILQTCSNTLSYCNPGSVLVGGKAGNIYGKWNVPGCFYEDGVMDCFASELLEDDIVYEITPEYLIAWSNVEAVYGRVLALNSMNSEYMYELLECLNSRCNDTPDPMHIDDDDSENVNKLIEELNVQKISRNDKSAQFILNNQTFDVVVDDTYGISDGFFDYSVKITVSSEGKTCNNTLQETNNIKPWCSTENAFFFDSDIIKRDDGEDSHYITKMRKDNADEFGPCLRTLISKTSAE